MNAHMECAACAALVSATHVAIFFRPNSRSGIQSGTCSASLRRTALPYDNAYMRKSRFERHPSQKLFPPDIRIWRCLSMGKHRANAFFHRRFVCYFMKSLNPKITQAVILGTDNNEGLAWDEAVMRGYEPKMKMLGYEET